MPHHKSHKYGICSKLKKNLLMHANKSRKKRVLTFCERRGDGPTEAAATATEAATAPGAIRDGAGDGAIGRD